MIVVMLTASILAFVAVLHFAGAAGLARDAASTAGGAAAVMRSRDIDDDEKERRIRIAAVRLFGSFLAITAVCVGAVAAAAAVVVLGSAFGLYRLAEAVEVGSGWPFILVSSIGMLLVWLLLRQSPRRTRKIDAQ
ncbi:hypothetical protein DLJ53_29650 [Acuticoccus sediminis]|uniref:Uncharacterized protein n=1 Tax=Acuticoccus sediminis TaxID=2184697 RepID=A0A8B2NHF9_9HYPH|nr:hypothetical protein [Acuticoccus sediminis]RAH97363.1 hypothetical protein DLJ53_29650 [Acuticoccus sediminis]